MAKLIKEYDYTVIDNEAGLEHLSRRTTRAADALVVVSDETAVGLKAAKRIAGLVKELDIKTGKRLLILNRSKGKTRPVDIQGLDLELIGRIPQDFEIENISLNGGSLMELKKDALSLIALREFGEKIWQNR